MRGLRLVVSNIVTANSTAMTTDTTRTHGLVRKEGASFAAEAADTSVGTQEVPPVGRAEAFGAPSVSSDRCPPPAGFYEALRNDLAQAYP